MGSGVFSFLWAEADRQTEHTKRVYLFSGRHGNVTSRWTHWFSECNNVIKVAVSVQELVNLVEKNSADASEHRN